MTTLNLDAALFFPKVQNDAARKIQRRWRGNQVRRQHLISILRIRSFGTSSCLIVLRRRSDVGAGLSGPAPTFDFHTSHGEALALSCLIVLRQIQMWVRGYQVRRPRKIHFGDTVHMIEFIGTGKASNWTR